MSTLLTNDNNDIYIDSTGSLVFADGKEATAQIIKNVLLTQRGELQLAINEGIPYFETVLGNNPDVYVWESYMVDAAEKVEHVQKVVSMESKVEGNTLRYTMQVQTDFGLVTVEG